MDMQYYQEDLSFEDVSERSQKNFQKWPTTTKRSSKASDYLTFLDKSLKFVGKKATTLSFLGYGVNKCFLLLLLLQGTQDMVILTPKINKAPLVDAFCTFKRYMKLKGHDRRLPQVSENLQSSEICLFFDNFHWPFEEVKGGKF